jgi:nitrous oxide reductase
VLIVEWGVVEVSVLRMAGRMVVATSVLVLAVGCAGGGPAPAGSAGQSVSAQPPPTQSPNGSPPRDASNKTISVRINNGKVEGVPARVEVNRGTRVRLEVTSDRSDELHVHGYDKTARLAPSSPAAVTFVADLPGVFEVETHDSGLLLFQLVVRE